MRRRHIIHALLFIAISIIAQPLYAPVFEFTTTYYCDYFVTPVGEEHTDCGQEYTSWGQLDGIYKRQVARNCGTGNLWPECFEKTCCTGEWQSIPCP